MASEVHVNDIGTDFVVTLYDGSTALDVSAASSITVYLTKPSGEVLTKTASFVTDGTDGQIKVSSADGDLDEPDVWHIQAKITLVNGNAWYTDVSRFRVHSNLV